MANALEDHLHPHTFVILRGEAGEIDRWRRELQRTWRPLVSVLAVPSDARDLPAALQDKLPRGTAVAYLCRGSTCEAPLASLAAVATALRPAGED
jgi:uncharacterized protein YyaL (SSP411 family)